MIGTKKHAPGGALAIPKHGVKRKVELPAIATVAAISTTIAAAPTTTTPSAATATTAASTIAAVSSTATTASAATAGALCLRSRFVDYQVPAAEVLTVQAVNHAFRVLVCRDLHKSEAAGLPGEAVTNQADRGWGHANLREPFLQLLFGSVERKISYVKLLHLRTPSARNLNLDCGAH